jgi:hypothetical protein
METVDWNDETFDTPPVGAAVVISTILIVAVIGWFGIIL